MLQKKQENPTIDMAKIQIKSEKLTPFGGLFSDYFRVMEQFDSTHRIASHTLKNVIKAYDEFGFPKESCSFEPLQSPTLDILHTRRPTARHLWEGFPDRRCT